MDYCNVRDIYAKRAPGREYPATIFLPFNSLAINAASEAEGDTIGDGANLPTTVLVEGSITLNSDEDSQNAAFTGDASEILLTNINGTTLDIGGTPVFGLQYEVQLASYSGESEAVVSASFGSQAFDWENNVIGGSGPLSSFALGYSDPGLAFEMPSFVWNVLPQVEPPAPSPAAVPPPVLGKLPSIESSIVDAFDDSVVLGFDVFSNFESGIGAPSQAFVENIVAQTSLAKSLAMEDGGIQEPKPLREAVLVAPPRNWYVNLGSDGKRTRQLLAISGFTNPLQTTADYFS